MSHWNLQVPKSNNAKSLAKWATDCINDGIPREIISHALLSQDPQSLSLHQLEARSQVQHSVIQVMVDRNLRGIEFEKGGDVEEAISLYESNVADWFSGNHPYDRLRVIYTRQGQILDAIRVCESFVKVADELISLGSRRGDLVPKRDRFLDYARKLRAKLSD